MPVLTAQEIEAAIAGGRIGLFTIDTSVFDQHGCNLSYRLLRSLGRLGTAGVQVVFSEVTVGEVTRHLAREAQTQAAKLRAALNQYRKTWRRPENLDALAPPIDLDRDAGQFAVETWAEYANSVGSIVVEAAGADGSELVRRYFATEPPFGAGAKGREFPDAIALLSLEAYAQERETLLLAVSRDYDWREFAQTSDHIVWVEHLAPALDHFNVAARFVADRIVAMLGQDQAPELSQEIESALEGYFEEAEFDIETHSELEVEASPAGAVVQHWSVASEPLIVGADDEEVSFTLQVECIVRFSASLEFYAWDSVDAEYVHLHSMEVGHEETCEVQLTATCSRVIGEEPEVRDLQVSKGRFHVDFGYVAPDWGPDD